MPLSVHAVTELDEWALEIDRIGGIEIVKQEREHLAIPILQVEPIGEQPIDVGLAGIFQYCQGLVLHLSCQAHLMQFLGFPEKFIPTQLPLSFTM